VGVNLNGAYCWQSGVWSRINWSDSRDILIRLHSQPKNSRNVEHIVTAYHTILFSVLSSWSQNGAMTADGLVAFVKNIVESLPSSSSQSSQSLQIAEFGEALVDLIWTVDLQLDELLGDAKGITSAYAKDAPKDDAFEKAAALQKNVEKDKASLSYILRQLVVSYLSTLCTIY
jgi:THO complex subunit 2